MLINKSREFGMSEIRQSLHFLLTVTSLVGIGVLIYFIVKDRKKIEGAYQKVATSLEQLQTFGQTASCLSCQLCNSTNPTIQGLVDATGLCAPGGCIDVSNCPVPLSN